MCGGVCVECVYCVWGEVWGWESVFGGWVGCVVDERVGGVVGGGVFWCDGGGGFEFDVWVCLYVRVEVEFDVVM